MAESTFDNAFPIEEIDDNSWMIGQVVISRHASEPDGPCWDDGKGAFFAISEAPSPKPSTRPLSDSCPIVEFSCGPVTEAFGMFAVGHAHLIIDGVVGTPQHVTLEWLAEKNLSFQIPEVYYHRVFDKSYYLVYSSLPAGRNLVYAWPEAKDDATMALWVNQIADACVELSQWSGSAMTGIDGDELFDYYLGQKTKDHDSMWHHENLRKSCEEIPLDCSEFVFALNNIHPLAFTVDEKGLVGISSWCEAGYVPKDWIGTKVSCNSFFQSSDICHKLWSEADQDNWHRHINAALRSRGFKEHWYKYYQWNHKRAEKLRETSQSAYEAMVCGKEVE
ncbi:kinase-like domain protein [Fusarium sp. NRRL 52700]|nr:kinase-like domain protein [Fusarium sp. NRRL 52700]